MKRIALVFYSLGLVFLSIQAQDTYTNPILAGFYPDPSICRVDDDFYLVNSSFSFFPGLPVFHSSDLVHWEQIGNALDRLEQVDLSGIRISGGLYAPTLRYNNGTFYIVCTVVDGIGNFVITAASPSGPWSIPTPLPHVQGMDPDLFFDADGKAYVSSCAPADPVLYDGHRAILMYEFYPESLTTSVEARLLVDGGAKPKEQPIWCEGPHLFKKDSFYLLICAEGGTSIDHSEVVFRSRSLDEPFESYANNPILSQRHWDLSIPEAVSNTGHADFVQLSDGEWWSVFLGCRPYNADNHFNIGRETFMLPVRWEEGWPIILKENERVPLACDVPNLEESVATTFPLNGSFDYTEHFSKATLPFYMLHIRTPKSTFYHCDSGLHLKLRPQTLDTKECPAFVGRRQQHTNFETVVSLDFSTEEKCELAGIAAFQNDECYYLLAQMADGFEVIQRELGVSKVLVTMKAKSNSAPCYLKITGDDKLYHFYISDDNSVWEEIGLGYDASFLSTAKAGGFVGTIIGMYASSNGNPSDNIAHFDWMKYVGL